MARPASRHPTELELEVLKILWRDGPSPARRVRDALAAEAGRDLALTSVLTVLGIMVRKKYLRRRKSPGGHLFDPLVRQQSTGRRMLQDLVDRVYDGSASAVMLQLLEHGKLDEAELAKLKDLIDRKSGEESR